MRVNFVDAPAGISIVTGHRYAEWLEIIMGTTYFVANSAKHQYFDPGRFGCENTKRSGILWGLSGHALAQLLLPDAELGFHLESWVGDPLCLVGDETSPNSIPPLRPFQHEAKQDAYHIVTEQFDDITLNLIALLCKHSEIMDFFLDNADRNVYGFVDLAHLILHLPARHVELNFTRRFGEDWQERYQAALAAEPWRYPRPYTS